MEIAIIGWYGTETIGDRAILAGIFNVLSRVYDVFTIRLGSIYPFYTERTVSEDMDFYKEISKNRLTELTIFNSRSPKELKQAISSSQIVMVGGGPLMDLAEMNMLEYAFLYATQKKKAKIIFGCGWGPLKDVNRIKQVGLLVQLSDATIFRDVISLRTCEEYIPNAMHKVKSSIDPACFACHFFKENAPQKKNDHVSINFRDVAIEGKQYSSKEIPDNIFINIVESVKQSTLLPIQLIPMHTFFIGGDDRVFLERIKTEINDPQVEVVHRPLSLCETMEQYYHAQMCVGMRFHSILLQTLLNGNNYIVDYTHPQKGKIMGLIGEFGMSDHYRTRYMSLYEGAPFEIKIEEKKVYTYSSEFVGQEIEKYVSVLKQYV